jgi:hypothetical protein
VAGEHAAGAGGQQAAAMALEQRLADRVLQLAQPPAGGRERQVRARAPRR